MKKPPGTWMERLIPNLAPEPAEGERLPGPGPKLLGPLNPPPPYASMAPSPAGPASALGVVGIREANWEPSVKKVKALRLMEPVPETTTPLTSSVTVKIADALASAADPNTNHAHAMTAGIRRIR